MIRHIPSKAYADMQQNVEITNGSVARERALFSANPWWVVVGSVVGLLVGNGAVVAFTFSLFLKPMVAEFGWDRGTVSAGLTVYQWVGAFATPVAGWLADVWGVRRATLFFVTAFSIAVATLSRMPHYVPMFLLLYGICGLAGSGQAPPPYAKAIATWFDEKRGLALGIGATGVGLGTALLPQVARALIAKFGWRNAYLGLGALTFLVGVSAVLFFVRERPFEQRASAPCEESRASSSATVTQSRGLSLAQAAKESRAFWYLTVSIFLISTVTNGFLAHVAPMVTDNGFSAKVAASVLTLAGLMMIVGKLLSGLLADHLFAPYVSAFFFLLALPGLLLFNAGSSLPFPFLGIIFIGISLGGVVALQTYLVAAYFGIRHYGAICGYYMGVLLLGAGLGPSLMGVSFDKTHSYHFAIAAFSIATVLSSLSVSQMGPYVFARPSKSR